LIKAWQIQDDELADQLSSIFPDLDWNHVHFFWGMPWFMLFARWAVGITLPHPGKPGHICIFLSKRAPKAGLNFQCLLVHELVHASQMQQLNSLYPANRFVFLEHYLGLWPSYGYRKHPMEVEAYEFEALYRRALMHQAVLPEFRTMEHKRTSSQRRLGKIFGLLLRIAMPLWIWSFPRINR
jgi:hypothetical protein